MKQVDLAKYIKNEEGSGLKQEKNADNFERKLDIF